MDTESSHNSSRTIEDDDIVTHTGDANALVCDRPCWLLSVQMTFIGVVRSQLKLYDGFSASDKLKLDLYTSQTEPLVIVFKKPVYLSRGLYKVHTINEPAMIQYAAA